MQVSLSSVGQGRAEAVPCVHCKSLLSSFLQCPMTCLHSRLRCWDEVVCVWQCGCHTENHKIIKI